MLRVLQCGGGSGHRSFREAYSCTVYTHPPRTTVSMLRYETSFVFLLVWGGHLLEYVYTREVRQLYSCKVGTRKVKRFRV